MTASSITSTIKPKLLCINVCELWRRDGAPRCITEHRSIVWLKAEVIAHHAWWHNASHHVTVNARTMAEITEEARYTLDKLWQWSHEHHAINTISGKDYHMVLRELWANNLHVGSNSSLNDERCHTPLDAVVLKVSTQLLAVLQLGLPLSGRNSFSTFQHKCSFRNEKTICFN